MHVGVDEARKQGSVAQVDHLGAGRRLHMPAGGDAHDLVADHQDFPVVDHMAAHAVEQVGGAQKHRMRRGGYRGGCVGGEAGARGQGGEGGCDDTAYGGSGHVGS
jgi:hypothetical protein